MRVLFLYIQLGSAEYSWPLIALSLTLVLLINQVNITKMIGAYNPAEWCKCFFYIDHDLFTLFSWPYLIILLKSSCLFIFMHWIRSQIESCNNGANWSGSPKRQLNIWWWCELLLHTAFSTCLCVQNVCWFGYGNRVWDLGLGPARFVIMDMWSRDTIQIV